MTDPTLQDCVGKRVLVSVNETSFPCMTTVRGFSPKGQYVWLCAGSTDDNVVGWRHVSRVTLLEVLGAATDTPQTLQVSLLAKAVTAST